VDRRGHGQHRRRPRRIDVQARVRNQGQRPYPAGSRRAARSCRQHPGSGAGDGPGLEPAETVSMQQQLVVLGATGTIGRNTLDVVRRNPERLRVLALSAHRDAAGLLALCREFRPDFAALADADAASELIAGLRAAGLATEVLTGADGVVQLAALP